MRKILFRAKRIYDKKWVEGNLFIGDREQHEICVGTPTVRITYPIILETVGEYIEVLDAYEGDVLYGDERDEYGMLTARWHGLIKYDCNSGRISVHDDSGNWYEVDDYVYDKIVGNIHDNPELFKEE